MRASYFTLAAALVFGAPSAMAALNSAGYGCDATPTPSALVTFSGAAWTDCAGFYTTAGGGDNITLASVNTALGTSLIADYKDNMVGAPGSDVTQIDFTSGANGAGSLTFGVSLTNPFAIAVKFGNDWAAYMFDVDVNAGDTWTFSTVLDGVDKIGGLSHGNLLIGREPVPNIPEPSTYALMIAGLGLMGFVARRRTRK